MQLLHNLKDRRALLWATAVAIVLFDVQYYALSRLPSISDEACAIGGARTVPNVLFALGVSICSGILIAGMITLIQQRRISKATSGATVLGIIIGLLSSLCVACVGPIVILVTLGNTAALFNPNSPLIKLISALLLLLSLVLMEKQLRGVCTYCKPSTAR